MTMNYTITCDKCGSDSDRVIYPSTLLLQGWLVIPASDPAVMDTHRCPQCALDGDGDE